MKHRSIDLFAGILGRQALDEWSAPLAQGAVAGSLASVLSSAVLMLMGRREAGSAAAPTNATSQWLWGDEALHQQQFDMRHTLNGYLIHHGAAVFWATAYAALARKRPALRSPAGIAAGAAATSAVACFVDFNLTPSRLTPGYEHRLSRPALAAVHGAFAIGLAAGAWALRDRYPEGPDPATADADHLREQRNGV